MIENIGSIIKAFQNLFTLDDSRTLLEVSKLAASASRAVSDLYAADAPPAVINAAKKVEAEYSAASFALLKASTARKSQRAMYLALRKEAWKQNPANKPKR